jgi:hypothetical protein
MKTIRFNMLYLFNKLIRIKSFEKKFLSRNFQLTPFTQP